VAHARPKTPVLTARAAGLIGCTTCGAASPAGTKTCPLCGSRLNSRQPHSLQRVWAWLLVGLAAYIPANLLPMMVTTLTGRRLESTIVGGVIDLVHHGAYFVAGIVFLASVVIPVSKFAVVAILAISIQRRIDIPVHTRMHLYEAVEFIGRWSMVDVFVVAILAALIQMGFFVSINPGPAAAFFALSVAFTMLAAQAMDPRLIWDSADAKAADD
jgi:paraquat-inducible protein A